MNHFFNTITNPDGKGLAGYFARVIDPTTQGIVTLAADNSGTPIITASGVANMAKTDVYGNVSFYVAPGTYHLDIYGTDATTFSYRIANVGMSSDKGDKGDPGIKGDTGASGTVSLSGIDFVTPQQFGAVADDTGTTGTDNLAAFNAAIAYLKTKALATSNVSNGGSKLFVPKGAYYLSDTLDIKGITIVIEGEGNGFQGAGYGTTLRFPAGKTGIRIQRYNTSGTGTATSTQGADGTIIRGLCLIGGGGASSTNAYGIHLRARAQVRDCVVRGFASHGVAVIASVSSGGTTEGNANNWEVHSCCLLSNGGSGLYTAGSDVNAGTAMAVDVSYNARWGIEDNSFLGNTYVGNHSAANTLGAYTTTNNNAWNDFLGCYSESGQPTSVFVYPTSVLGGIHAAGVSGTGMWLKNFFGAVASDGGFFSDNGTTTSRLNYAGYLQEFTAPNTPLGHQWQVSGSDIRFTYGGADANEMFRVTGPTSNSAAGTHRWLTNRFALGNGTNAVPLAAQTTAPTGNDYPINSYVHNSNAVAGQPRGWKRLANGTWIADANW